MERLEAGGLILGVMRTPVPYEQGSVTIGKGDMVCLFTDGVSEAMNSRGDEFGEERIETILREAGSATVLALRRSIVDAVTDWSGTAAQTDDITLVLFRRLS